MFIISKSVGLDAVNNSNDVKIIQECLNALLKLIPLTKKLSTDGMIGIKTINAIKEFQANMVGDFSVPSGRVEPHSSTIKSIITHLRLNRPNQSIQLPPISSSPKLSQKDYDDAAQLIGCEVEAIQAIAQVETRNGAFLDSGRPPILFEAHWFSKMTGRIYDVLYPSISSRQWNRTLYFGGEKEYRRLLKAMILNRQAALKSTSWGRFQIMGFNHLACGYSDVESFVKDMWDSEKKQLDAFVNYINYRGLDELIMSNDWSNFAELYNGSGYKANHYDTRIERAYNELKGE